MGATTLAFFPVRKALVTEGQSEIILLASLIREVTNKDHFGFQVVSGLSQASLSCLPSTESAGRKVAYLVDSDGGGEDLKNNLQKMEIPSDRIFSLSGNFTSGMTFEDFIATTMFVKAINSLMDQDPKGSKTIRLSDSDIKINDKFKSYESFCKKRKIKVHCNPPITSRS